MVADDRAAGDPEVGLELARDRAVLRRVVEEEAVETKTSKAMSASIALRPSRRSCG
jgi:hypothetical protein